VYGLACVLPWWRGRPWLRVAGSKADLAGTVARATKAPNCRPIEESAPECKESGVRVRRTLSLLSIVLGACAAHRPLSSPVPPSTPSLPAANGLQVALLWSAPVDLDLYLTDPTWETVYFANNPSRTGARLLRDARCGDVAATDTVFVELAGMTAPLPGRYRIGVDFIDACNAPHEPVGFRVVVNCGGVRRESVGTIRLEEFQPIVVEFELRRTGSDETLTLVQEGK
jgi:hypothetical protein